MSEVGCQSGICLKRAGICVVLLSRLEHCHFRQIPSNVGASPNDDVPISLMIWDFAHFVMPMDSLMCTIRWICALSSEQF